MTSTLNNAITVSSAFNSPAALVTPLSPEQDRKRASQEQAEVIKKESTESMPTRIISIKKFEKASNRLTRSQSKKNEQEISHHTSNMQS